jgi:hypothetical protein
MPLKSGFFYFIDEKTDRLETLPFPAMLRDNKKRS